MHIISNQGTEVLRAQYTVTDDINGVPTLETDFLQLLKHHDTPINIMSQAFIDNYVLVIKDEQAVADSSLSKLIGVHQFVYDMNLDYVYEEFTQYFSIENILGLIFDSTDYTFEVKGDKTYYALHFENFGDKDKMSLIQQVCSRWEAEYHINGTHVVFGDRRGTTTKEMFRYKMNILNSNVNLDISKGATYIRGYFGKKAETEGDIDTYIEKEYTHPLAEQYGIKHAKPYSNENITVTETMNEYLKRKVEETWVLSIELDVVDLIGTGNAKVGDTVWAIDERMDIQIQTRIIKVVYHYDINDKVYKTTLTLGNYNFIESVRNTENEATDIKEELDKTNKRIEDMNANWDSDFNKERDELIKRVNDEMERQKEEVQADFDAWKLYEEQARQSIKDSVDNIIGDMDSIDTTIEEWQNTASSRFNTIESNLLDKLNFGDLQPLESRLEANEKGIEGVFTNLGQLSGARNIISSENISYIESVKLFTVGDYISSGDYVLSVQNPLYHDTDINLKVYSTVEGKIVYHINTTLTDFSSPFKFSLDSSIKEPTFLITISNFTKADFEKAKIQLERGTEMTEWSPALGDVGNVAELSSRLTFNEEKLETTFTRSENNEADIANFQITADGLSSSIGTLRSDLDDMEQWSLAAGSDWQQTKEGFDRYVVANNETVDGLRTDVTNIVERADGISSTVSSMRGSVDDLVAWRADAGSKWEQTSQAITGRVWQQDIDAIEMGVENLIPNADIANWTSSTVPSEWKYATGAGEIWSGRQNSEYILVRANYLEIKNNTTYGIATPILTKDVIEGEEYTLVFNNFDYGDFPYDNMYLLDEDGTSNQSLGTPSHDKFVRKWTSSNSSKNVERLILTVIPKFSGRARISFAKRIKAGEQAMFYINEPMLVKGNKAPMSFSPSSMDFLQHTDFRLQADGFFLGTAFVGGSHYATAIVGDASGLKLIGDKISIDGNLDVLGRIRSESISAVYANISEVRTRILVANSIKANMLDVTQLMAEKFYTHTAFINNASIKAANIRDLESISLTSEQVRVGFNKIGSNIQITNSGLETRSSGTITSRVYNAGHEFFRAGNRVGKIGTASWYQHPTHRGLSFQLDPGASYFSFGLEEDIEDVYSAKLMWHKNGNATTKGFTMNDDLRVSGDAYFTNDVVVQRTLRANYQISAGTRATLQSSANGFRLYADSDVYLYLTDTGHLAVNHKGTAKFVQFT